MPEAKARSFVAVLHSSDASAGVAVPIRLNGTAETYTLADDEYLVIDYVSIVAVVGGDTILNVGTAAGTTLGTVVWRGSPGANAFIHPCFPCPGWQSSNDGKGLFIKSPAGVIDVIVFGTIGKSSVGTYPSYQAK